MSPADSRQDEGIVQAAVCAFSLGRPERVWPLGGTATPKFAVQTSQGRFVVRVRTAAFAEDRPTRFDHEALARLAAAGLPVPCPRRRPDGTSFLRFQNRVVEVLSWVEGDPWVPGDPLTAGNVGRFLARFHGALKDDIPPGKEDFLREDHPDLLIPYVRQLDALSRSPGQSRQFQRIGQQIELVRENLDRRLWPRLPQAVTHGDLHPGNVRFRNGQVAAVYDFDYLSVQARVHDLVHALVFFAARRDSEMDVDDIVSLTQPFTLDRDLSRHLLDGYQQAAKLQTVEWEAMPWVLRSQWLQYRLRGSRKVPEDRKVAYVLDRFFEVIDWLDRDAAPFFQSLQLP